MEKLPKLKSSNDPIWNQTNDLPNVAQSLNQVCYRMWSRAVQTHYMVVG
jgi:hypothetical protein